MKKFTAGQIMLILIVACVILAGFSSTYAFVKYHPLYVLIGLIPIGAASQVIEWVLNAFVYSKVEVKE